MGPKKTGHPNPKSTVEMQPVQTETSITPAEEVPSPANCEKKDENLTPAKKESAEPKKSDPSDSRRHWTRSSSGCWRRFDPTKSEISLSASVEENKKDQRAEITVIDSDEERRIEKSKMIMTKLMADRKIRLNAEMDKLGKYAEYKRAGTEWILGQYKRCNIKCAACDEPATDMKYTGFDDEQITWPVCQEHKSANTNDSWNDRYAMFADPYQSFRGFPRIPLS